MFWLLSRLPFTSVSYMKRAHSSPQLLSYLLAAVSSLSWVICLALAPAAASASLASVPVSCGLPLLTALAM
ncbi:hypothetical protein D9M68_921590 [compost metagenome]